MSNDYAMLNYEEEIIILGSWFKGNNREDQYYLEANLFQHKELYKAIQDRKSWTQIVNDKQTDGIPLSALMDYMSVDYYGAVANALQIQKNVYANRIKEGTQDTQDLLEKIAELQARIDNVEYKAMTTDYKALFIKELEERLEESQAQYGRGFKWLDTYTGGIHRGQLITLGARPGIGKSAFGLQVAYNVAEQGYKVLYLPLEMTNYETFERLLLQQQVVDRSELKNLTEQNREDIGSFLDELEDQHNFIIYEGLNQLEGIKKKIKEERPYLVVIDQLSMVTREGKYRDIRESYTAITRELKRVALDNKVAILLLSQLNRKTIDLTEPTKENLAESDTIGQDSDTVLLLYTEDEEENIYKTQRATKLKIDKQRNGVTGKHIDLMFDGERVTFSPVDSTQATQQASGKRW